MSEITWLTLCAHVNVYDFHNYYTLAYNKDNSNNNNDDNSQPSKNHKASSEQMGNYRMV